MRARGAVEGAAPPAARARRLATPAAAWRRSVASRRRMTHRGRMRTRHATVAGALALASMLLAAFAPPTAAQAPERRIAYRLPGMDAVARRESIPYRSLA